MDPKNFDYILRSYRTNPLNLAVENEIRNASNAGDHDFLIRNNWSEVFRQNNPGGFTVLYKRANSLDYPRTRQ